MQKFVLIFTLGFLVLTGCQNTPKTASDAPAPSAPATEAPVVESAPASPEAIKQVITSANSTRELALSLRNQLDKLPSGVKSKNKELVDGFYSDIEGVMEKGGYIIGEMLKVSGGAEKQAEATEDMPANPVTQDVVKDYSESAERYNQLLKEIQQKIDALKGGN